MSYESSIETYLSKLSNFFSKPAVYITCISALMIWGFFNIRYADPDLFARVAIGKLIANQGEVPQIDPFAFTAKKPIWVDHEWLSGVVFYNLSQLLGGDAVLFLSKILFALLTLFAVYKTMQLMQTLAGTQFSSIPFWLLFFAIRSSYVWVSTIRSQVFTYLFFPLLLYILLKADRQKRPFLLLFLPIIFLFWANLHGGFVSGLGIFLMYIVGVTVDRRSIPWLLLCSFIFSLLAPCLNPYGALTYWSFIIEAISMPRPQIPEWDALDLFSPVALGVHLFSIFLVVGIVKYWREIEPKNLNLSYLLPILTSAYFAYKHERLVALFVISGVTLGLPYLDQTICLLKKILYRWFNLGVLVGSSCLILAIPFFLYPFFVFFLNFSSFKLDYSEYPVAATEWLMQHGSGGKLLVDFSSGSFALWRLYPKYQISLDGRYEELYSDETAHLVTDALSFHDAKSKAALTALDPDLILYYTDILTEKNIEIFLPGWQKVYSDPLYTVVTKAVSVQNNASAVEKNSIQIWQPNF